MPRRIKSVDELFSRDRNDHLIYGIWDLIVDRHPPINDLAMLPEEARVVMMIWHVRGILSNGGFHSLFEADHLPGDPRYEQLLRAFETIGCVSAAEAFREAFRLFPEGVPPAEPDRRLKQYLRGFGKRRYTIDKGFFDLDDEIEIRLAAYVRDHRDAWERIEALPSVDKTAFELVDAKPAPFVPADGMIDPSFLPPPFRVTFAAGCAQVVKPLFKEYWPNAGLRNRWALARAIRLTWRVGLGKRTDPRKLENALQETIRLAGAVMAQGIYGIPLASPPTLDGNDASIALSVAKAAEMAVRTTLANPDETANMALTAYQYALNAAMKADEPDSVRLINEFYQILIGKKIEGSR